MGIFHVLQILTEYSVSKSGSVRIAYVLQNARQAYTFLWVKDNEG